MHCPYCGRRETEVVETRDTEETDAIRRRRACASCGKRFTTYERIETVHLSVIKRDGKREAFDRNKLKTGILRACEKTVVPLLEIERIVSEVEREARCAEKSEIESAAIGELVARELKQLDKVAYIRFASVFKRFVDAEDFEKEVKGLTATEHKMTV
jgi:transcriptional repressor NrdR